MPRVPKQTEENFWAGVDIKGPDECWVWTRYVSKKTGYGRSSWKGKARDAHRLAYEFANGSIPSGLLVRHTCNNRLCCNPKHLLAGTYQQNSNDMVSSGNSTRGEKNASAILSEEDVLEIRHLIGFGSKTLTSIARQYSVSLNTISDIKHYKTWKHLTPPEPESNK